MAIGRIVSGGQTGVDRAALDAAIRHEIPYGGWCPRGGWAEDLPHPPGVLTAYPRLSETPSADPTERTVWNVRDSDATLVLLAGGRDSPGMTLAIAAAEQLVRPLLVADLGDRDVIDEVRAWLSGLDDETVLNVAGPRESESPGCYAKAAAVLDTLLT